MDNYYITTVKLGVKEIKELLEKSTPDTEYLAFKILHTPISSKIAGQITLLKKDEELEGA